MIFVVCPVGPGTEVAEVSRALLAEGGGLPRDSPAAFPAVLALGPDGVDHVGELEVGWHRVDPVGTVKWFPTDGARELGEVYYFLALSFGFNAFLQAPGAERVTARQSLWLAV